MKKEYIKINGGAAGEETKVIATDTLRAGADLVVQIIGPADTIQHSVYIVNEQTGEYQSAQLNKARENVTFSGYNFDSGSTYRLTVYTVTRQYQMLMPVNKIIQVTGQKPTVPAIDLPDTMKASQNIEIRSDIDDEILLTENSYSTEGELIDTYVRTLYYGRFDLNSWSFYDKYEDGGTIQVKYAVHYGELWSEWSETKTIIVTPLQFGVNVIGFPDTVENGQDFGVSFEYEGYVDSCGYTIRVEDSDDDISSISSGESQLGSDGGAGTIQIETLNLDKGRYTFTMYFYADGASKTVYQKTFEVVGERTNPPDVTAEQTIVYGYYASSQKKYVTVNGTKPSGPEVSVEKEPQYANQNVVFSISVLSQ